ncbi:MAG: hypothetical protein AAF730_19730 [Bacteroidota bacterium]
MGYHYAISTSKKQRRARIFFDRTQKGLLERVSHLPRCSLSQRQRATLTNWPLDLLDTPDHGLALTPHDPALVGAMLSQLKDGVEGVCSGREDWICVDTRAALEAAIALCDEAKQRQIPVYLFMVP